MNLKLRIIFSIAYFLLATAVIGSSYLAYSFLNKNFYKTITESNEMISLQKNISTSDIDIKNFNKILEELEKKKNGYTDINEIRDPFY